MSPSYTSFDELLENFEGKENKYAEILGCKPGEHPWTMSNNFLGRAERLAKRIQQISNQELLIRIANESQVLCIKCAAIRNIVSQEVLIKYAQHSSSEVRLASICNLKDQTTLIKLATTDTNASVRDVAIKKVKDSKAVKVYLMNVNRDILDSDLNAISEVNDLKDLAIYAKHCSVRKNAASLLPKGSPETQLLKAAADISINIEPYAIERFKNAIKQVKQNNDGLLNKIAIEYPFPGVRYLAREKASITPKKSSNTEELLHSKTPSYNEVKQQEKIKQCEYLLLTARDTAEAFLKKCHNSAEHGETRCELIKGMSSSDLSYDDSRILAKLLRNELNKKGFTRAYVNTEVERSNNGKGEPLRYNYKIYSNW